MAKKEKEVKAKKVKKEKKAKKEKKPSYFKEVRMEMKKVTFPSAKEIVTYTVATIVIVCFLIVFFLAVTALLSLIREAF